MNKMRLLKTKMESQKNLKVCWIPDETFFLWSYEVHVLFPLLHATFLRRLVLICMCFLLQTSGVGTMLLHDSGNHSGFMWEQQPRYINQHLFTMATSLVWTDIVETRKTLYPPLTWTNTHFSWISPHFSICFTQINWNLDNSNSH